MLPTIEDERLAPEQRENDRKPGGVGTIPGEQYWNGRGRGCGGEPDGENTTSCAEEHLATSMRDELASNTGGAG